MSDPIDPETLTARMVSPPTGQDLALAAVRIAAQMARMAKSTVNVDITFDGEGRLTKIDTRTYTK